jgi:ABC-type Na+ transport system ATPase subunit NatA
MIKVTNLVKNYGDFQAVRDISFDVDEVSGAERSHDSR